MRSMREYLDGFQGGSGWTEIDVMLCLVTDCEAGVAREGKKATGPPRKICRKKPARSSKSNNPILPTTLERPQQETHHILVTRTAIKYVIIYNFV